MRRSRFAPLLLLAAAQSPPPEAPVPQVTFSHLGLIERYCERVSPNKPNRAVMAELGRRTQEFARIWSAAGPELMRASVAVTGRPWPFAETLATLHACPDLDAMSAPLLIDAGYYLTGRPAPEAGAADPPLSADQAADFAYVVWHELEHRHVGGILATFPNRRTPLLERYAAEPPVTRFHLHLFAIEELVYRRLGRQEEFRRRREARRDPAYVRAFQIVQAEGAERWVAELRPH